MIPALLGASLASNFLGNIINRFQPHPVYASAPAPAFSPYLQSTSNPPVANVPPSGILTSAQWSQSNPQQLSSWLQGLAGHPVNATDGSGRTISGIFGGVFPMGNTLAVNIGGQVTSLAQLQQISWSPIL